jgi:hypothetical protein
MPDESATEETTGAPAGSTSSGAEAAGYRRRLRETETERDALAARVTELRTAEVERIAGERLARAGDLLELSGLTVDELLDDDGLIDTARLGAALDTMLEARPYLARRRFQGSADSGVRTTATPPATSWHDVLNG